MWDLIQISKNGSDYLSPYTQYSNLVGILSVLDEAVILQLEKKWRRKVKALIKHPEFINLHINCGGIVDSGEDGFYSDFPNWLVAQGETLYKAFLEKGHKQVLSYIKKYSIESDELTFENMVYAFGDALDNKSDEIADVIVTPSDIANMTETARYNYILSRLVIKGDIVGYRVTYNLKKDVGIKFVPWSFDIALEDIWGSKERKLFELLSKHSVELIPYRDLYISEDQLRGVNPISLESKEQIKAVFAGLKRWATL